MIPIRANIGGGVKISQREWRWMLIWATLILLVTSLPYLYGVTLSTSANQFGGFVIGVEDGNAYLAKMRLGATGNWRFYLFYTSEPHEGVYLFLFHLLLGKIARLSGMSFVLVYHLARVVLGFILLLTIYYFTAFFTDIRQVRQLTFWMVVWGSGLGWLVALLGWLDWLGLPLDFYLPEAFIFHLLFALPHLSLAQALLLGAMIFVLISWERRQWPYALLAGLALLGVATIAAFYVLVAVAVIGTGTLLRRWRTYGGTVSNLVGVAQTIRKDGWSEIGLTVLAFVIPSPVLLYNAYVFTTNPIFKMWRIENLFLSPSPVHYLLAIGLLVPLAVMGGWREWRHGSRRSLLLIGWCVIVLLLLYIPFGFQRRLMFGVQVPLSILATLGLWQWLSTPNVLRHWRVVSIVLVTLLSLSNLMILMGSVLEVSRRSPPVFHPATQISAADWLGAHAASDEVVLGAYETGNYLPVRMPARVFVGHVTETIHSKAKQAMLPQFFASNNDDVRRQLLQDYRVTYLFYGPAERALGNFSPDEVSYLRQVYDNGAVQIYRVVSN